MQKKYIKFLIRLLLITIAGTMLSCAADKAPLQTENSLPQDQLAYYSDPFDKIRDDLWDRAGYLYREEQMENFKQADMYTDNGKLVLRTQTGSFSKGGLATRYALRGDFDIQLDCRMDFGKVISRTDMDQLFSFAVLDKSLRAGKMNFVVIGLVMKWGLGQGGVFSNCVVNGKRKRGRMHWTENFSGSFRILRKGKYISVLYKMTETTDWTPKTTFRVTGNDMMVGFQLRNFVNTRTTIRANHSISAEVDRFIINAAQEIIEDEI